MSLQIVPPTPAPPPKPGLTRHQYVLVLGKNDLEAELNKNPHAIDDILINYFGFAALYVEKVMSGDLHGWHLYYDFAEGEFEENLGNTEEKD